MGEDTAMAPAVASAVAVAIDSKPSTPSSSSVQADIAHNLGTLRSAVAILEPRLTTRVLRTLTSIRKRLTGAALREAVEAGFPAGECSSSSSSVVSH